MTATLAEEEILDRLPDPDPEWAPAWYSKSLCPITRGGAVKKFAQTFVTGSKEERVTEPFIFTPWQEWLINGLLEEDLETGNYRYRKALIGIPRKNGKSMLASILALYALAFGKRGDQIYSAAKTREQAKVVYDEVEKQILNNRYLYSHIEIRANYMKNKKTGAIYKALAADAKTAQGLGPSLVIADELHAWTSEGRSTAGEDMWAALTEGSGDRSESLVIAITTAGGRKDTLCGELYDYGVQVSKGEIEDPSFGFWWWEATEDMDPFSEETWKRANPNYALGLLNRKEFISSARMATSIDMSSFLRYKLNMWVRLKGEDFISTFHWNKAKKENAKIPLGAKITVGFDGAITDDCTMFVIMDIETGLMEIAYAWHGDPSDENFIVPKHEVNEALDNIFEEYDVQMLYADKAYYGSEAKQWAWKYPRRVSAFNANAIRMAPMARDWLQDIFAGDIFHTGDELLTTHVMNAVLSPKGIPIKEKAGSPHKIDALYASILANGARHHAKSTSNRGELPDF